MPIYIPRIIKELRENATEEQRKGLSILENKFYECIELKKENSELVQKIQILENQLSGKTEQLKEAEKTLYNVWDCRGSREYYAEKAKEYFEKWGVE